jgi:hypothetical protein
MPLNGAVSGQRSYYKLVVRQTRGSNNGHPRVVPRPDESQLTSSRSDGTQLDGSPSGGLPLNGSARNSVQLDDVQRND